MRVEFGILGSLEVRVDGGAPVALGGLRQRALLAVLVLHANEAVSTDRLVDLLWGEHPPPSAVHAVQVIVSRLRRALAPAGNRLATRPPGYALEVGAGELDADRYEDLCAEARAALRGGAPDRAAAVLRVAETLWRGPPLGEFAYQPFAQPKIARLDELRVSCDEDRVEAELLLGHHAHVLADLEALVREHPFRERLHGQLMLALYRCGRQAEALDAYQRARRMLVDELAVEPSDALKELERAILRQDRSLQIAAAISPPEGSEPEPERALAPAHIMQSAPRVVADESLGTLTRKLATVLVARLAEDTAVGHADPEIVRESITRAREEAERVIRRHGGEFVAGLSGEIMGIFGMPLTKEDDALRAVRAADELRARVHAAATDGKTERLVIRVSLATGEVVGEATGDLYGEPLDDAIELLQETPHGEVLLSDATRRLAASAIRAERALGGCGWRLVSLAAEPLEPPERSWPPMVGREHELSIACSTFARAADEGPQLMTIVGDPGIGKSRFAQAVDEKLRGQAMILVGHCLSYGDGIAYWPLREAIVQAAGDASRDGIRALLGATQDADLVADVIAATIGLSSAGSVGEQVPWAFRTLFDVLARRRPVILVIEDAHWADAPLLELVDYLVDWLAAPVLILCLARPELLDAQPSWGGGRMRVQSLVLDPLSDDDALRLLDYQRGERALDARQVSQILRSAEGNPLFVEHLLAVNLEDPHWDEDGGRIPATIQSLLAARLDRLGPAERAVIQRAAVIGRRFWSGAVAQLLPPEAQQSAATHLRALVHRGLVQPDRSTMAGEDALRFRHLLIRDVAYGTTPKRLRSELHERFSDWLAQRKGYDEFVGHHLRQSFQYRRELREDDGHAIELAVRAGEHLAAAGRQALWRGDSNASVRLLRGSAEMFRAADRARPDVLLDLGTALDESGALHDAERELRAALEQARSTGSEAIIARALIELSDLHAVLDSGARVEETEEVAKGAIRVFKRIGDESGLARAWLHLADVHWTRCRFAKMEEVLNEALKHAERAGVPWEESRILGHLARAAVMGPRPADDAARRCNAILARADADVHLTAVAQTMLAILDAMQGRVDGARDRWHATTRRLEDVGLTITVSLLQMYRAMIELLADDPADVVPELERSCVLLQGMGEQSRMASTAALLARLLYRNARYQDAQSYGDISATAVARDDVAAQVLWQGTSAKLLARRGEEPRAEEAANHAVALAEATDFLMLHGDALRDRAEVLEILHEPKRASRDLAVAIRLYDRKGIRASAIVARRSKGSPAAGLSSDMTL